MRLVPVKYLKVDAELGMPIMNDEGKIILEAGQALTVQSIDMLENMGVADVYINDKYCFHKNPKSQKDMIIFIKHQGDLREISSKLADGTLGIDEIKQVYHIGMEAIKNIKDNKDYKISYKPNNFFVGSSIEQSVYVAIMSIKLGIVNGLKPASLTNIFVATILKDLGNPEREDSSISCLVKKYRLDDEIVKTIVQLNEPKENGNLDNKDMNKLTNGVIGSSGEAQKKESNKLSKIISIIEKYYILNTTYDATNYNQTTFNKELKSILANSDMKILRYFLANVEVFPRNTIVKLNNGDVAVVIKQSPFNVFYPEVCVIQGKVSKNNQIISLINARNVKVKSVLYFID
ncbi:MAG: hypothetical protein ATN36_06830 [Epulopiscium sp. Nele67-Bin005]|nr:MAG: hypothetical protein ATN36_06830 [Epulopiscium sp. Nele67-Bin005]